MFAEYTKITDITGPIHDGMWSYGPPFPEYRLKQLEQPAWVPYKVNCELYEGLNSQTGTYFETPGHFPEAGNVYFVEDIPFERLIDIPCSIIKLQGDYYSENRRKITGEELQCAAEGLPVKEGGALLICSNWGGHWSEPCYLSASPYFSYEAMMYLLEFKPFLMGSDMPRWDNLDDPQGFFSHFYARNVTMLGPCVRLEALPPTGLLSVLPLAVAKSCCVPCRAFVRHNRADDDAIKE